jgi:hypothetical protein
MLTGKLLPTAAVEAFPVTGAVVWIGTFTDPETGKFKEVCGILVSPFVTGIPLPE